MEVVSQFVLDRRERWKRYYRRHKEELLAKKKPYNSKRYKEKRESIRRYQKEWYLKNRERQSIKDREYRKNHLETKLRQCREWHRAHKDDPDFKAKRKIRAHLGYLKNKNTRLKQHKEWRAKNPGHWRSLMQKRRALEKKSAINLRGIKQWMSSVRKKGFAACYYCMSVIESKLIHFDHIIPLSKGGPHSLENLCVSCKACNLSKGSTFLRDWDRAGQQVLEL